MEASVRAQPNAIRIPKAKYAKEAQRIDEKITAIEKKAGLPEDGIKLWCNIESYLGVLNAIEITFASPRVVAMALGTEDFTASMTARRTKPGWEVFYARNHTEACVLNGGMVDSPWSCGPRRLSLRQRLPASKLKV